MNTKIRTSQRKEYEIHARIVAVFRYHFLWENLIRKWTCEGQNAAAVVPEAPGTPRTPARTEREWNPNNWLFAYPGGRGWGRPGDFASIVQIRTLPECLARLLRPRRHGGKYGPLECVRPNGREPIGDALLGFLVHLFRGTSKARGPRHCWKCYAEIKWENYSVNCRLCIVQRCYVEVGMLY